LEEEDYENSQDDAENIRVLESGMDRHSIIIAKGNDTCTTLKISISDKIIPIPDPRGTG